VAGWPAAEAKAACEELTHWITSSSTITNDLGGRTIEDRP